MKKLSLFLDSGAYSAMSKGAKIDIYDYIDFINNHKEDITIYSNLDVIGDAEQTLKNQQIMEDAGLTPLPCFHRGEDWKYLHYYIKNYDYLALGGVAKDKDRSHLKQWMNDCWDIICDTPDRLPKVKVHGFAITSLEIMVKYPWYSADSTSWVLTGRFGSIYVPVYKNGKWVYDENTWKITVSSQSPGKKVEGQHFSTLSASQQRMILNYIESKGFKMGKSEFKVVEKGYKLKENERWYNVEDAQLLRQDVVDAGEYVPGEYLIHGKNEKGEPYVEIIIEPGVFNDYKQRDEMNIIFFCDLEKSLPPWPWPYTRRGVKGFGLLQEG